jgi:saccharopine dehydrogenase-like NADP-dependent oxidoreductase
LDLTEAEGLNSAIATADLVIHCAGPFGYRDSRVLERCIDHQVPYLDVSDNPEFVQRSLALADQAQAAGITAVISTGIFPGISNSMVRLGVEALDISETVHLSYVVVGSGGAGLTVMRTTFLEIRKPFRAWIEGQWQWIQPYRDREQVTFPEPYGKANVYGFSTSEAVTLPQSFPLKTVITKFGSLPGIYNQLTGLMTWIPSVILSRPGTIEALAKISYQMTQVSDRFTGIGIAMRAKVIGQKQEQPAIAEVTFVHPHMIDTVGCGTGSIAQLILSGQLQKPGVWPVEQSLASSQFLKTLQQRGLAVQQHLL